MKKILLPIFILVLSTIGFSQDKATKKALIKEDKVALKNDKKTLKEDEKCYKKMM